MNRHGQPIHEYALSGSDRLNVGITFGDSYREISACVAAGLDYSRWIGGDYSREVMDAVLAWYDLSRLIEANIEDERSREMKKGRRKKS